MQESIILQNICKSFGDKRVLDSLTLEFPLGQISCLMGKSGSGKTTLMRILLGFETPDSGEIVNLPSSIICMFQEDRLCEDFSVYSNIRLASPKMTAKEIDRHLAELDLTGEGKRPVRLLSGGMKRRVALIRAIVAPSEMLLLDEPFKGLDERTACLAADYLSRHTEGKTVLLVTHEREDATRLDAPVYSLPDHDCKIDA